MKNTTKTLRCGKFLLALAAAVQLILFICLITDSLKLGAVQSVFISCIGIIIVCVETIFLFHSITREMDTAYQEEILKLTEYQTEYNRIRQESIDRHEEKTLEIKAKLLDTISQIENYLLENDSACSKSEFFHEYAGNIKSMFEETRQFYWCENPFVNILIEDKKRIADQYGIDMNCMLDVPEEMPVTPPQLCSVFSNLLDNALEAANQADTDEKWISVKAAIISGFFVLKVENSFRSSPDTQHGEHRIFKKNSGEIHGIGLHIVKKISEKCNGRLITEEKDNIFRAIVYMEYKKKGEKIK